MTRDAGVHRVWRTVSFVAGGAGALVGLLLCPNPWAEREEQAGHACTQQLYALAWGMLVYADSHDGRLPSAATWAADIAPYLRKGDRPTLTCPSRSRPGEVTYAMCARWSGCSLDKVGDPMSMVLLYEVRDGAPAFPHRTLPRNLSKYPAWLCGRAVMDRRPNSYMWVVYGDGHKAAKSELPQAVLTSGIDPMPF